MPVRLIPARLISREAAAAYVCVSPNTFDEMVKDRRMPRPRRLVGRRKAWDIRELDEAVDNLPIDGNEVSDETWSNVDGP